MVTKVCAHCGKEFTRERSTAQFCCEVCAVASRRARKKAASKQITVVCDNPDCKRLLIRNPSGVKANNFCDHACRAAWKKSTWTELVCTAPGCGKTFRVPFSQRQQKTCSHACGRALVAHNNILEFERRSKLLDPARPRPLLASDRLQEQPFAGLWRGKGDRPAYTPFDCPFLLVEWEGPDERDVQTPEGSWVPEEIPAAVRELPTVGADQGGASLRVRGLPGGAVGLVQGF